MVTHESISFSQLIEERKESQLEKVREILDEAYKSGDSNYIDRVEQAIKNLNEMILNGKLENIAKDSRDFFKPTSKIVAKNLIGMNIKRGKDIFIVNATTPYLGRTGRKTKSTERLPHSKIMMLKMVTPHFCVSTGIGEDLDYLYIDELLKNGKKITSAKGISGSLKLNMGYNGKNFFDYFVLEGETRKSDFVEKKSNDAETCLGHYRLIKS